MATITIPENVARQLEEIARRENRSPAEVLVSLLAAYRSTLIEDQEDAGVREVRSRTYARARRYWANTGDHERLALTDEELDEQFWLIDPDGIPRLKSEQGTIELPPDPLLIMLEMAEEANLPFSEDDVSERSREILRNEYADHLWRRMRQDDVSE